MLYKNILEHIKKHGEGWNELYRARVPYNYLFDEDTLSVAFVNRQYELLCERVGKRFWFKIRDIDAFRVFNSHFPPEGNTWLDMGGYNKEFFRHFIYDDNSVGDLTPVKEVCKIFDMLEDDFCALDIVSMEVPFYSEQNAERKQKKSRYTDKSHEGVTENPFTHENVLKKRYDPLGAAIADYYIVTEELHKKATGKLYLSEPMLGKREMTVSEFFLQQNGFAGIKENIQRFIKGRVLVIGAGAGSYALYLQEKGFTPTAVDISQYIVETMQKQGVRDVRLLNFWDIKEKYDTILMPMNAMGLVGRINKMPDFFRHIDSILETDGSVIIESKDIIDMFAISSDLYDLPPTDYYGELEYSMQYKQVEGKSFPWLYIDFETLQKEAQKHGFDLYDIPSSDISQRYLAKLVRLDASNNKSSNGLQPKSFYQGPTKTCHSCK